MRPRLTQKEERLQFFQIYIVCVAYIFWTTKRFIITQSMSFISINQEMKGNHCANALLRHSHTINDFYWWPHLPRSRRLDLFRDG